VAVTTHRLTAGSTSNVAAFTTGATSVAVGDLPSAWIGASGQTGVPTVVDSQGVTWTRIAAARALKVGSVDALDYYVRPSLVATASAAFTLTITYPAAATGCIWSILTTTGMTKTGAAAVVSGAGGRPVQPELDDP
jgi:hypothetical protein